MLPGFSEQDGSRIVSESRCVGGDSGGGGVNETNE